MEMAWGRNYKAVIINTFLIANSMVTALTKHKRINFAKISNLNYMINIYLLLLLLLTLRKKISSDPGFELWSLHTDVLPFVPPRQITRPGLNFPL